MSMDCGVVLMSLLGEESIGLRRAMGDNRGCNIEPGDG